MAAPAGLAPWAPAGLLPVAAPTGLAPWAPAGLLPVAAPAGLAPWAPAGLLPAGAPAGLLPVAFAPPCLSAPTVCITFLFSGLTASLLFKVSFSTSLK